MLSYLKVLIALFLGFLLFSCKQKNGLANIKYSPIQKERIMMHEKFVSIVEYYKLEMKLKKLSKKTFNESTLKDARNRMEYAWRLGKLDQLKEDIPAYLNSKFFNDDESFRADWNLLIHMWEYPPSEWSRFVEMIDELYIYFKNTGNVKAEQKMLGARIQGAHLMGDTLNERKYLLQMLKEIRPNDKRYETYYPMLGWWYQDHGQWNKSINIFKKQYKLTKSENMLSSLIWGLFNDGQYEKVLTYEDEILKLDDYKVYYILAKSHKEFGKAEKANYYYEKFSKQNHMGPDVDFYFTERNDNKFYLYDQSYLMKVADYFSTKDASYSCKLNKHIYKMIKGSLNSDYAVSLERKVILAQGLPEQQQIQTKKYHKKRKVLLKELQVLRTKCEECEAIGLITFRISKTK